MRRQGLTDMPLGMLAWRDGVLREQRLEESESDVQRVGWCAVVAVDVGHPGASRDDDVGREAGNETREGRSLMAFSSSRGRREGEGGERAVLAAAVYTLRLCEKDAPSKLGRPQNGLGKDMHED